MQPVDRPASRRRDGRDQRQPPGRVDGRNGGLAVRHKAARSVTGHDGLALHGHRYRVAGGTDHCPVLGLLDARHLDTESQVPARLPPSADTSPARRLARQRETRSCPPVPPRRMIESARPYGPSNSTVRCSISPAFTRARSPSACCRSALRTRSGPQQQVRCDQPRRAGPHDAHDRIAQAHKRQCSLTISARSAPARPGTPPPASSCALAAQEISSAE